MSTKLRLVSCALWVLPLACGLAAPTRAQSRLYAQPELRGGNPFQPTETSHVKLPVALSGFSVVELRERQQWVPGQANYQLIFDGQIYWFAGARDRDIFAAAPHEYAPALASDCIVTYVDTGERVMGKLEFGLIHRRKLYFFAGETERQRFQENTSYYANGDLAQGGRCLVSQIEEGKSIVGLPVTVAVVNGLRYHFAGAFERRLFATNPTHYGVRRVLDLAPGDEPFRAASSQARMSESHADRQQTSAGAVQLPGEELEESDDQHYAMEGYCPVSLLEQGVWIRGSYQNHVDFEGNRYVLAGEKEKKMFLEDPERFVPVLTGDCIVSQVDEGKLTPGSVYHSLIFEGKLYLFAGPEQVKSFKADPVKYIQPLASPDVEIAPVEPPQEDAAPAEDPSSEGNVLREGRRSEFRGRSSRR